MRIEKISQEADRAGRYRVTFEDGTFMRLYRQTVEDFGLYSGMELSAKTISDLRTAAGKMSARMRAVRIVAASNVSQRDLEQRLVQKGESAAQAREAGPAPMQATLAAFFSVGADRVFMPRAFSCSIA